MSIRYLEKEVEPDRIRLYYHPKDRLRMTIQEDRSFVTVKPVWASPLSYPEKHLALLNGKGEEIFSIAEPKVLPRESYDAVKQELSRRYLTAQIDRIVDARCEFGATYWQVETSRGTRDFVTQNLQENAQWLSPTHLMLIDVDGNRFEITDSQALDTKSRELLETTV